MAGPVISVVSSTEHPTTFNKSLLIITVMQKKSSSMVNVIGRKGEF